MAKDRKIIVEPGLASINMSATVQVGEHAEVFAEFQMSGVASLSLDQPPSLQEALPAGAEVPIMTGELEIEIAFPSSDHSVWAVKLEDLSGTARRIR
jgi:hypothetical protein